LKKESRTFILQKTNEKLKKELRMRTQQLSFFIDVGKALTSTLEFKKVINVIMEKAQKLIQCEVWALLLVDEYCQELHLELAKGAKRRRIKDLRIKLGSGAAGWVAARGNPLMLTNLQKEKNASTAVPIWPFIRILNQSSVFLS